MLVNDIAWKQERFGMTMEGEMTNEKEQKCRLLAGVVDMSVLCILRVCDGAFIIELQKRAGAIRNSAEGHGGGR